MVITRSASLKKYGLNPAEIKGYRVGFFLAIDGDAFRDDPDDRDEFGQQEHLVIDSDPAFIKEAFLGDAAESMGLSDLWEIVNLATGSVLEFGNTLDDDNAEFEGVID